MMNKGHELQPNLVIILECGSTRHIKDMKNNLLSCFNAVVLQSKGFDENSTLFWPLRQKWSGLHCSDPGKEGELERVWYCFHSFHCCWAMLLNQGLVADKL